MGGLRYLIVGSGYRAEFYGRIAGTYPELFRAMYLCRSEEKAALMRQKTGADATTSREAAERFSPDFVVVAVNKANIADVCGEWAERGYPVLSETPAGVSLAQLENAQDEFAIAAMLLDMGAYLKGGPEPYPLREALDDAYFWLLARQAAAAPWTPVESRRMPWNVNESCKE